MIVVNEMTLSNLVVGHLNSTSQLGKYHHLDILVLNENCMILFIGLFIRNLLNNGIRINGST